MRLAGVMLALATLAAMGGCGEPSALAMNREAVTLAALNAMSSNGVQPWGPERVDITAHSITAYGVGMEGFVAQAHADNGSYYACRDLVQRLMAMGINPRTENVTVTIRLYGYTDRPSPTGQPIVLDWRGAWYDPRTDRIY